ncbi:MAG: PEP-CTERM sorting domain-containing protein [Planctomycetota bacterium]
MKITAALWLALPFALAPSALGDTFTLTAHDQGWISSSGQTNATGNYYSGLIFATEYRSWWLFALPTLPGTITSATLRTPAGDVIVIGGASETVRFGSVATTPAALAARTGGLAAFASLSSGMLFAQHDYTRADTGLNVDVALNAAAIAALNGAQGGEFAIGNCITTFDGGSITEGVFGNTTFANGVSLMLTYDVPAPGSLVAIGVGAIGAMRRRR